MTQNFVDGDTDSKTMDTNIEQVLNVLRILSMLEKSLNRLARKNYYNRNQYPEVFIELETSIQSLRSWINTYRTYCMLRSYYVVTILSIQEISRLIEELLVSCKPLSGKKEVKKSSQIQRIFKESIWRITGKIHINSMLPCFT